MGPEPVTTTAGRAVEEVMGGVGAAAAAVTAMVMGTEHQHASPAASQANPTSASAVPDTSAAAGGAAIPAGVLSAGATSAGTAAPAASKTEAEKKQEPASGLKDIASGVAQPQTHPKSEAEKKQDPASGIKEAADGDIRSECQVYLFCILCKLSTHFSHILLNILSDLSADAIPASLTSATHTATPVVASAVATVTGADLLRGTPSDSLPVSSSEEKAVQAQALKGDNAALSGKIDPVGGASVTDPAQATTDNAAAGAGSAKAAASANNLSKPPVAVNESGFASNVDPATGGLPTADADKKQGGDKAAAIAAGSAGALGAAAVGGGVASLSGTKSTKESNVTDAKAPTSAPGTSALPPASSTPAPGLSSTDGSAAAVAATPAAAAATTTVPSKSSTPAANKTLPDAPTDINKRSAPGVVAGKTSAAVAPTSSLSAKDTPAGSNAPAGASSSTAAAIRNDTAGASAAPAISGAATTKAGAAAGSSIGSTTNGTSSKPKPATEAKAATTAKPAAEAPKTPTKNTSEGKRTSKFGTLGSRKAPQHDAQSSVDGSQDHRRETSEAASQRDRKKSLFGKIKAAISPHSSPSK